MIDLDKSPCVDCIHHKYVAHGLNGNVRLPHVCTFDERKPSSCYELRREGAPCGKEALLFSPKEVV